MGMPYEIDFELFVKEHLGMNDVDFTKNEKGEFVDSMTTCLHILWGQGCGFDAAYKGV